MTITPVYTATATASGGRDGRSRTLDGSLDVKLATPKEMGGDGNGNNPEQLFAAGYAACYVGAMKYAASQDKTLPRVPADIAVQANVGIGARADQGFGLTVTLEVTLPGIEREAAQRLIDAGHGICPYSHATRGNIDVVTTLKDLAAA